MENFLHVFYFYLQKQIRNKVFGAVTLFLCIASSITILVVPKLFSGNEKKEIYIVNQCNQLKEIFESHDFKSVCSEILNIKISMVDVERTSIDTENQVEDDDHTIIYFYGDSEITMKIIGDVPVTDIDSLHSVLSQMLQIQSIEALGIDRNTLQENIPKITIDYANEEEDDSKYIAIVVLSLIMVSFIIMYSTSATNEVAYLKTNRVMEILLTSTRGIPLYLGINLAYAVVPFIQVSLMSLCMLLMKHIFYSNVNSSVSFDFSILKPMHIIVFVFFLLLGYFVYSLINTALVSMVNKSEDIVGISVPISFIGLIQYFIGIMAITENTIFVKVFSYIPFTSPTVMFIRYVGGFATIYEVLSAMVILLATIYLLLRWGTRVFTTGITNYSFKGNIRQAIKKGRDR